MQEHVYGDPTSYMMQIDIIERKVSDIMETNEKHVNNVHQWLNSTPKVPLSQTHHVAAHLNT